jgi:hypothetical protein
MAGKMLLRPLVRLPAVIFPGQAVSFTRRGSAATAAMPFELPSELLAMAWRESEGRITVFGPGARIGTELHIIYDDVLDAVIPTPPGVVHAVGGDRVRLSRTVGRRDLDHPLCEVEALDDEMLSEARQERLEDEAAAARDLLAIGVERGDVLLESSADDDEFATPVCDPRCHPMWPLQSEMPDDAAELSLWLGARLPLSTGLRVSMLGTLCPLRRIQDAVDALRLLCDPHRPQRHGHRFRVIFNHPATDDLCGTLGGSAQPPRATVAAAPPQYARWSSDTSFPHG